MELLICYRVGTVTSTATRPLATHSYMFLIRPSRGSWGGGLLNCSSSDRQGGLGRGR